MRKRLAALLCAVSVLDLSAVLPAKAAPATDQTALYEAAVSEGGFFTAAEDAGDTAQIKWQTKINKGTRNGFPTCAADNEYLYTAAVDRVYKIDKQTGQTVGTAKLSAQIAYTYYITAADGKLFVQLADGTVQALSADTLKTLWVSETPVCGAQGQGLSPVIYDEGFVYASTVVMSKRLGTGSYYCIDAGAAENGKNSFVWQLEAADNSASSSGFYRAGAASAGDRLIFGSEGGTLYMADKHSGEIIDTAAVDGDIRSTAVYDGGEVFFTTKTGYIYAAETDENGFGNIRCVKFCADSTCEPVIYGGKIYVGGSEGGYTNGVFCVLSQDTLSELARFEVIGNVQARPLLMQNGGGTTVYFTCNYTPGRMMRLSDGAEGYKLTEFFAPEGEYAQYCINGVTADADGTLYYQNDSGCLAALEAPVREWVPAETDVPTETTTQTTPQTMTETASEMTTSSDEGTETTTKAASHSGGGSGSRAEDSISVSVEITGDSVHGTSPHTAYRTWVGRTDYKVRNGSTAEDVVIKALEENGFEYVLQKNGYLSCVTSPDGTVLEEFSNGVNSGWMYTVNGDFPQTAMGAYRLNEGDEVVLRYVDDYTVQSKPYRSSSSGSSDTSTEQTTETAAAAETEVTEKESTVSEDEKEENVFDAAEGIDIEFFDDIEEGIWYFYPVECLHAAGIVSGRGGNLFCPAENVTRAELATLLYRIYGDDGEYKADFSDTPPNAWYSTAVGWARANGVIYGIDGTNFAPDSPVTRQDAAVMLYRLSRCGGEAAATDFEDAADIAPYAANAVAVLAERGIISGTDKNLFLPYKNAVRAETAVILFRFINAEFEIDDMQ